MTKCRLHHYKQLVHQQSCRKLANRSTCNNLFVEQKKSFTNYLSSRFILRSCFASAFICNISTGSGLRRRMYSSWFPMERARILLFVSITGTPNTKSYKSKASPFFVYVSDRAKNCGFLYASWGFTKAFI